MSNFGNTTFAREETARRHAQWLQERGMDQLIEDSQKDARERAEDAAMHRSRLGKIVADDR